ncbi:aquaporin-like [Phlebotomus argentipes]|uniref:aquaporin-like n=1 Tax=Phlebotomus argentipes TaxID=94469 RepID=UPI0028929CFD|nr:aquaporin-like [Phlebotomus argentipes]
MLDTRNEIYHQKTAEIGVSIIGDTHAFQTQPSQVSSNADLLDSYAAQEKPKILGISEETFDNITKFAAEVAGTAILLFVGCASCVTGLDVDPPPMLTPLSFGFIVTAIITIFGHISGAHLNPSVTILALILRMISPWMALFYVIAQVVGAIVGYGFLVAITPAEVFAKEDALCTTTVHEKLSIGEAFLTEFLITSVLIFTVCGVWDPRTTKLQDSSAIRVGFVVAVLSIAGGPYTGASMNPARSLAPAIYTGVFDDQWIYWVAPPLAAICTAYLYKFVFWREDTERKNV